MSSDSFSLARKGLLGKVSLLLSPSLAVSAIGTYVGRDITSTFTMIMLMIGFFGGSWFIPAVSRRSQGLGGLLLFAWVFESGVFIGPAIHQYVTSLGWQTVFDAYMFSAFAMCALGAYGFLSKRDFSGWALPLFFALLALIVVMLVGLFIHIGAFGNMLIALAGMAIFSLLFIFDFSRLKHQEDNWTTAYMATVQIYLDYMNFLLFFLQFSGANKSK